MRVMHSMEYDDEDKLDQARDCAPLGAKGPDFPYNLKISLTDKEFRKMPGLDPEDAVVGGIVHGFFMARITSVSSNQQNGKKACCVELQIEDLGLESEDEENEDED